MVKEKEEKSSIVKGQGEQMDESLAKKISSLMYKKKKLMGSYYQRTGFKEPFLILQRRNGECEIFEEATKGYFSYDHSDGSERKILLKPIWQIKLKFLDDSPRGYYCHEDSPIPLTAPDNMPFMVEEFWGAIEKVYRDQKDWDDSKKVIEHFTGFVKALVPLALAIGGIWIVWVLVAPDQAVIQTVEQAPAVTEAVKETINNSGVLDK